jgi:hypothetical protein
MGYHGERGEFWQIVKELVEETQRNQKCGNRFKKIIKTMKIEKWPSGGPLAFSNWSSIRNWKIMERLLCLCVWMEDWYSFFPIHFFCLLIKNAVDTQIWWGRERKKIAPLFCFRWMMMRESFLNRNVKRCIYTHTRPGWHMEREWGDINSELMYHATGLEKTSSTSYYIAAIKTFPRVMTGIYTTGGLSLVPSNLCWTVV